MAEQLAKIVKDGNRLAALEVLRDRLAEELDDSTDSRALPALALRFTDVLSQIDEMPQKFGGAADVIAARRRQRRGEAG